MTLMANVPDKTFRETMDEEAVSDPGRVYCTFKGQSITFGQLNEEVNRLANSLLGLGLKKGDHVGVMLPGHPDHIVTIFALAKVGLVRIPINTSLKGPALDYPFSTFAVDALIADSAYAEPLAPILESHGLKAVVWRSGLPASVRAGLRYEELAAAGDPRAPAVAPGPDDIIAITPSSGTTGAPKGVLKSDRTLRAGPMAVLRLTGARPGETLLFWESLHHGAGVAVCIAAVLGKLTLGMVERFSASRFWAQAREVGATRVHYLGSVLPMVLKQPESPGDRSHGATIAWGGGCPLELWRPVEERFNVQIREGYGLSELITFCLINMDGRVGSVGKPLSWYEAMVADEKGEPCPAGKVGELCLRATVPGLHFLGYFRNEKATRETMRGDWFRTGDLVRQDEDGYFFFAGRAKDAVRRRGINISAWEVERVLLDHPAIEEVALIGVPSELGEDEIKIFVRKAQGADLSPSELIRWCEPRLPRFQMPRYIAFVEEFPRTPTQRIRKLELSRETSGCWDYEKSGLAI
ncbi:AMP-binding protein [Bosea sp. (in: a-proteobacteria)]|uniref:AMP-binding protein n=1 Tax=Bosea sp. (in: a-proteobacteria) TaxID=1871050 RepID=UPI002617485E|nr:AMP-binding protein [Bosea sp. (in: a-proteobacteria)]MCO5093502.1 AMP-binding protein [Bosea sp. (in: a-proteobacteria)]